MNNFDNLDLNKMSTFELIPYNIVGIFKVLVAKHLENFSIQELLFYSSLIDLKPYIEMGNYSTNDLIKYFNSIFDKKQLSINKYKFKTVFEDLNFDYLEDCVRATCLLTMILIYIVDNPEIEIELIEEALMSESLNITENIESLLNERLAYQECYLIRTLCSHLFPIVLLEELNLSKLKLKEEDITNFNDFDFIDFETDPLGNGFEANIIADFYKSIATDKFIDQEHDDFIESIFENKDNIKKNILSLNPSLNSKTISKIDTSLNDENVLNLAFFYLYGIFVEQNYEKSFELFKQLSEAGHGEASYMLSKFYSKAIYVNFDADKFSSYLTLSVSQGSESATSFLQDLFITYQRKKYIDRELSFYQPGFSFALNGKDRDNYIKRYNETIKKINENNEIIEWKFTNSSKSQEIISNRLNNKLNIECLKLLKSKTDYLISEYKKYINDYNQSLQEIFNESDKISSKKDLICILTDFDERDFNSDLVLKIADLLFELNEFSLPDHDPNIRYEPDCENIHKSEYKHAILCWYFLAIDSGATSCIEKAFEFFEYNHCPKNIYTDEFFMKIAKKHHDFRILKIYNLDNLSQLRQLVDYGFKFANCKIIDIYVEKNDLESANQKLKLFLNRCSDSELYKLKNSPYTYFNCCKTTNIKDCLKDLTLSLSRKKQNQSSYSYSSKKEGCYIATCVYGSYDCSPVWILRRYRDHYLRKSLFGRLFIKIYYSFSPIIIKIFGKCNWFRKPMKSILDRKVIKLKEKGYLDTPYND